MPHIKGITIEIDGNTSKLNKAMQSSNSIITQSQSNLKVLNQLLKLDPKNVELVTQKQENLKTEIQAVEEKLKLEKTALEQAMANGDNSDKAVQEQKNLKAEIAKTEGQLKYLQDEFKSTEKAAQDMGKKATVDTEKLTSGCKKALKSLTKITVSLVSAAGAGAVAFAKSSVQAGMDFDSSMSQVAATMGKTTDEISDLRDYAQDMGKTTAFSATEAADALNYMALAGYDSGEAMDMLPNVLNLAAAGGIDLASASDMVTDAQSALGLSFSQTTEMVDKMAKASSKSNTSVEQLGQAFLTIGGTAKNLKGGTTELATSLGILADNGVKGSEGGTALRNILLSLTPKSKDAAEAFKKIGLNAYDADGNMRSLKDIFGDINTAMDGMSDEEKTNILKKIFNKNDLKSVNALLATSTERWDELSSAIDDSKGAAEAMADTQLDNLEGDVTLFNSALETAKINISDELSPALRSFVQMGTEQVTKFADGFKEGGLNGALNAVIPNFDKLKNTLTALGSVIGVVTVAVGAYTVKESISAAVAASKTKTLSGLIIKKIADAAATMGQVAPYILITAAIVGLIVGIVALVKNWDKVKEKGKEAGDFLKNKWTEATDKAKKRNEEFKENTKAAFQDVSDSIKSKWTEATDKAKERNEAFKENTKTTFNKVLNFFKNNWSSLLLLIVNPFAGAFSLVYKNNTEFKAKVDGLLDSIKTKFTNLKGSAKTWGKDMIQGFIDGIKKKISALGTTVKKVAKTIWEQLHFSVPEKGPLADADTWMPDFMKLLTSGIDKGIPDISDRIQKLTALMSSPVILSVGSTSANGGMSSSDTAAIITLLSRYLPELSKKQDVTIDGKTLVGYIDRGLGELI